MHHSINLHENIGVSDLVRAETEIDAVIYRSEFEGHYQEYIKTKSESELILAFIFLQIYVECFLHQNMRKIVDLEFKPPRDWVFKQWMEKEKRHVPEKLNHFCTLFFVSANKYIRDSIEHIGKPFRNITNIRNQFLHGHKVATWFDSSGNSGLTPARSLLTGIQIKQTIIEMNELGLAWNELLGSILPQCKVLRGVDDFKFSNLER